MDKGKLLKLLGSLILPIGLGSIAEIITAKEISAWYATLNKPSFNPPGYLFGPVWSALYILIGVSMFLIWNTPKTELRQKALTFFGIQLFFNFWWSILFFSFHKILILLVDILLMWFLIICMILLFKKINQLRLVYKFLILPGQHMRQYSIFQFGI